jgi:4'-phosphopantetheinyl transferase
MISLDEVHIWNASLDVPDDTIRNAWAILSPDEVARAEGLRLERDRKRFVVARGILRKILSAILDVPPSVVRFETTSHGKPVLAAEHARVGIQFNLSHSHDLALFAVTQSRGVGIDVEYIREIDAVNVAEHFFSRGEYENLRRLPADQQRAAFFTCWTRKEAYIKARGEGLARSLQSFEVSILPEKPQLLWCEDDPTEIDRWSFANVSPCAEYAATLAVEGHGCVISTWHWQHS